MAKSPVRVKIVIEENGKDIASEYIGHEVIKAAVCCRPTWSSPPIHQKVFKFLMRIPHTGVREDIASYNQDADVFKFLITLNDHRVLRNLVNNDQFLKTATEEVLLELIAKDQSLACDVANNLSTIQENVDVDINAIVKALERLGNHEVDTNLANNSSFKRTVSKLTNHQDPITAAIAEGTLS
jgi:hypothetical protein